jgi:uncharacterized glyoxalase superfamily protein PhnB
MRTRLDDPTTEEGGHGGDQQTRHSPAPARPRGTFERLQASGAEVVQEPIEQPYGVRDCAFRDPAGNLIRLNELR